MMTDPSTKDHSIDRWVIQVRKGLLELCILNALRQGERYGYELARSVTGVPGLAMPAGTIYPLLLRLKDQGLVASRIEESPEGPARKYYALTDAGRTALDQMNRYWESLARGITQLRTTGRNGEHDDGT